MSPPVFLITVATGKQGGAATRHLLQARARVRVLVRNPSSPSAQALQDLGADLSHGSFDDPNSLQAACANITAVFLNPSPNFSEPGTELRQAKNVVHAARTAGHETFPDWENWPADSGLRQYFLSKAAIEDLVRHAGFQQYTIFRPPLFMTNFVLPSVKYYLPDLVSSGVIRTAMTPSKRAMLMAPDDIGQFVMAALLDPGKYAGLELDIGGEALTMEQMAAAFSEVSGKKVSAEFIPEEEAISLAKTNMQIDVQRWFWERHKVDPKAVEEWSGIRLTSFKEFLMANKNGVLPIFS